MSGQAATEKHWELIQKKTFTGWVNNHLRKRALVVQNIEHDFEDGLKLIALLEIISDDVFTYKYDKKPKIRIQKVGNVGMALNFVKNKGVNLVGIAAEEIVDGNLKLILGMIWTIILRFQIQDISVEDLSAKEALLLWCQKKTAGYSGVSVKNFHMSFQDGLAFCALIHKHRPDLIDWENLDKTNKQLCLETAFDVAEKHLDVPRLLDPSDLLDVAKPDERSVMTYVSLYYHVFASSQKAEGAGKRVAKLLDFADANDRIKDDYLNRAQKLKQWIGDTTTSMEDRNFPNNLEGVLGLVDDLKVYKTDDKAPKYKEKIDLEALLSGLNAKLNINNRPPYEAPNGLTTKDINGYWVQLEKAEHDRSVALREELRRLKKLQDLITKFNQLARKLENFASDRRSYLTQPNYGETVAEVNAKINNLDAFESEYSAQTNRLDTLRGLAAQLQELSYNDMATVNGRVAGIESTWQILRGDSDRRREALLAQLAKLQEIETMLLDFAKRGLEFRVWLENADEVLTDPFSVESVSAINDLKHHFETFLHEKSGKEGDFQYLGQLASKCAQNNVAEGTYSEVSWATLEDSWNKIENLIHQRRSALDAELARQEANEALRVEFAQKAKAFHDWNNGQSNAIQHLTGEIQHQLDNLIHINQDISQGRAHYDELVQLTQRLDEAQVSDNPHTELTIETLKSQFDSLNILAHNRQQVLEKELLAQSGTGLSQAQITEFKECFKHFDKDEDHLLNRLELGACLKSLGEDVDLKQEGGKLDQIMTAIDQDGDGKANFEEFASYMERISSGSDTPDSIKHAFKTLAGDKDYVTEADLRAVLPNDKVEYCLKHMQPYPNVPGGYNYNTFTDKLYGH